MCCWTHNDPLYPGPVASETVDDRCRCPCGGPLVPCRRRATEEDIRCDVCAGRIPAPEPAQLKQQAAKRWAAERQAEIDRWAAEHPVVIKPEWLEGVRLWPPPETPGPAA